MNFRFIRRQLFTQGSPYSILFLILLFVLFIYPSPNSALFVIIKILLILLLTVLFNKLVPLLDFQFPFGKSTETEEVKEANAELENSRVQAKEREGTTFSDRILNIGGIYRRNLSLAFYLVDKSSGQLVMKSSSGNDLLLHEKILVDDQILAIIQPSPEVKIFTPDNNQLIFNRFIRNGSHRSPSMTFLIKSSSVGEIRGLVVTFTERFSSLIPEDKEILDDVSAILMEQIDEELKGMAYREKIVFFERLFSMEEEFTCYTSDTKFYTDFVKFCESQFTFDKMMVLLFNPEKTKGEIKVVRGYSMDYPEGSEVLLDESLPKIIMKEKLFYSPDLSIDPLVTGRYKRGDIHDFPIRSYLGASIVKRSETIGVISIESFKANAFDELDKFYLQLLGRELGSLISRREEYYAMENSATRDGLTGLLNHKTFLDRAELELERASRYQYTFVLMILDLDKFKRVNDTYGHLFGDHVLREVARRIKGSVRTVDFVGRYGGEEFAVLLVNTSKEQINNTAKRIVESVAADKISSEGIEITITISGGLAEFPVDGETVNQLITFSDKLMYEVKRKGGNDVGL